LPAIFLPCTADLLRGFAFLLILAHIADRLGVIVGVAAKVRCL
jgi:hypothetical protein